MGYNREFIDTMDNINNIAYGYGFKNGIEWANVAQKRGELDWGTFKQYENAHNLRVRMAHGNSRDINISFDTYNLVRDFEHRISSSYLRKNGSNGGKRRAEPKLPDGVFRSGKPYIKEFFRTGNDGEQYYFKFAVYKETNYLDDGNGGAYGYGYFIHIENAPYFQYASERRHEFHIISTSTDYHICWNKVIEGFEEANAVMYVWVNRYADLLDVLKKDKSISESALIKKANRKSVLPSGTFRNDWNRSNAFHKSKNSQRKTISITKSIYDQIMSVLGQKKPELGGMLGFTLDQDFIDNYVFDEGARVTSDEYNPDIEFLNEIISTEWEKKRIYLAGFVHSHPGDFNRLSYADIDYAKRIMAAFDMNYLFMPIVTSSYAYISAMTGYIVKRNGYIEKVNIEVVPGKEEQEAIEGEEATKDDIPNSDLLKSIEQTFAEMDKRRKPEIDPEQVKTAPKEEQNAVFSRISKSINLDYMKDCSIIGIGLGGSKSFYESMARMGVGNFYLMDGDVSALPNVASQNAYLSELGQLKTDALKARLLNINKDINVETFPVMLDDSLDDTFLEDNIISKIDPAKTVICAFTDDFFAQARISNIALKYKIPFVSGQHHQYGITSELIFWYPAVTKHSFDEIAKTRFESYKNGFKNNVTSEGSPIFNTTRLNALCEKIVTGMLLYKAPRHSSYSDFLDMMNDKNLILIRQTQLPEDHPFYDFFSNDINSYFDDVSWINPESVEDIVDMNSQEKIVRDTRIIFN